MGKSNVSRNIAEYFLRPYSQDLYHGLHPETVGSATNVAKVSDEFRHEFQCRAVLE
jgi:hypothetical protein